MFVDLLNSYNYIMVNMDAIRVFGLHSAVYTSELLNIYKKAVLKKRLVKAIDGDYFKVDRKFIEKRTTLSVDDQINCDVKLIQAGVLKQYNNDADTLKFDVELFASLIAEEDVKLVQKTLRSVPQTAKETKQSAIVTRLKESVVCSNLELLTAIRGWIDAIFAGPSPFLSLRQVELFQKTLNEYTKGDLDLALKVVELATVHAYKDCQWAINLVENSNKPFSRQTATVRTTRQERATKQTVDQQNIF